MSPVHDFTVPEELTGTRLDRVLSILNDNWSRSRVRRLIDGGGVRVNDKTAKPATLVEAGDHLTVDEPEPEVLDVIAEAISLTIIHEDDDLLVIDKPANLVIHPAAPSSTTARTFRESAASPGRGSSTAWIRTPPVSWWWPRTIAPTRR